MEDRFLAEDLQKLVEAKDVEWEAFRGSRVVITGATGLVGSLLCKAFLKANDAFDLKVSVIGLVRSEQKAKSLFGADFDREDLQFVIGDITAPCRLDGPVDYIFHCASVTASKVMISQPVETLITSVEGTHQMLELAKAKEVKSFVYVSSMEMYGSFTGLDHDVTEEDLGYVNPLAVRSNYPESKRLCENMCVAYFTEYGVPAKSARLAQTFGAGILPGENRVFAQFARSAIKGENIVLHTKGLSEGNYCYTTDTVRGLLTIALKGANGESYNVSNPETHISIADMAKMVCEELAEGKIQVIFDIPETNSFGYAADTKMKLSSDKLQKLGWKPQVGLKEAYNRLIGSICDTDNF